MVPYDPSNPFTPYSQPNIHPDPLQAALTNINMDTYRLAPQQPPRSPQPPMRYPQPPGGPAQNPYPNPLPGPGRGIWDSIPAPRFPNVQEQVPRMNERIMREMRENRRPSLPKPSAMPQPPRANPTGAAHKPHQPTQY